MSEVQTDTPVVQAPASIDSIVDAAKAGNSGAEQQLVDNTPAGDAKETSTPVESVPASGETPKPAEGSEAPSSSEKDDWEELLTEIEAPDKEESVETQEQETSTEPVAVKETPTTTVVEPEKTPQPPVTEPISTTTATVETLVPQTTPQETEKPTPAVTEVPKPTSEQIAEANRQLVEKFEQSLVEGYQITEENDVKELMQAPETAMPKFAAKIHAKVLQQVLSTMGDMMNKQLPGMVQNLIQTTQVVQSSTDAFYSAWNELKPYNDAVQFASNFMQRDPEAQKLSPDAYINKLGKLAWTLSALDANDLVVKLANKENAQGNTNLTPNVVTEIVQGVTPINPGGGPVIPAPVKSGNIFENYAEEILNEEES